MRNMKVTCSVTNIWSQSKTAAVGLEASTYSHDKDPDEDVDWVVVRNVLEHAHGGIEARLSGDLLRQRQLVHAQGSLRKQTHRFNIGFFSRTRRPRPHGEWITLNLPTILSSSCACSSSSPALPLNRLKVCSQSSKSPYSHSSSLL